MASKIANLRIFEDDQGKFNRSLLDVRGAVLLISQFTLAADTRSGTRPSFTPAAAPAEAERLFAYCLAQARGYPVRVASGEFGADMQVALVNDGPVTFSLRVAPPAEETAARAN
jgi:D-tyrosyl-tRNA(Tyr) deacylase